MLDRQDQHVHQFNLLGIVIEIIQGLSHRPLNDVFDWYQATVHLVLRHRLEYRLDGRIRQVERLSHRRLSGFFGVRA